MYPMSCICDTYRSPKHPRHPRLLLPLLPDLPYLHTFGERKLLLEPLLLRGIWL